MAGVGRDDSSAVPTDRTHGRDRLVRLIAGLVAFGSAVAATVWLNERVAGGTVPPSALWEQLPPDSRVIVLVAASCVVVGAAVHTPFAVMRNDRVVVGWTVAAGLAVYTVPVGWLGAGLASIAPPDDPFETAGDPGALDQAFVATVTAGYAVIPIAGWLFDARPRAPSVGAVPARDHRLRVRERLVVVTLFSWLLGLPMAFLLMTNWIGRTDFGAAVLPASARGYTVIGVIGFAVAVVAAAGMSVVRATGSRTPIDGRMPRMYPQIVAVVGVVMLLVGVGLNQLGRWLPGWAALPALIAVGAVVAAIARRRAAGRLPAVPEHRITLRRYAGTRVDVVEVLSSRATWQMTRVKDTEGETEVVCRFTDGTVRALTRRWWAPVPENYSVGASLSVRWHPFERHVEGEPGPAVVPGTRATPPDAGQYVCRLRRPVRDAPADRDVTLEIGGGSVDVSSDELAFDGAAALRLGWALVRYDEAAQRVTEVIPFRAPGQAPSESAELSP